MAALMAAMCICYCIISITWSGFQNGGLHDEKEQRKWFYGESFSFSGALPSKDTLVSQNFDNADQNRWHAVSLFVTASETSEKLSDFAAIIEEMFDCQSNQTLELISSQDHISPTIFDISDWVSDV